MNFKWSVRFECSVKRYAILFRFLERKKVEYGTLSRPSFLLLLSLLFRLLKWCSLCRMLSTCTMYEYLLCVDFDFDDELRDDQPKKNEKCATTERSRACMHFVFVSFVRFYRLKKSKWFSLHPGQGYVPYSVLLFFFFNLLSIACPPNKKAYYGGMPRSATKWVFNINFGERIICIRKRKHRMNFLCWLLGILLPSMNIYSGNETENEIYCQLFESLPHTHCARRSFSNHCGRHLSSNGASQIRKRRSKESKLSSCFVSFLHYFCCWCFRISALTASHPHICQMSFALPLSYALPLAPARSI